MSAREPGQLLNRAARTLSWWGLDSLAIPAWRAVVRRNGGLLDAHFALGEALLQRAAWREAGEAFREVVVRAPGHAEAWGNIALACARQGAVERAVSALERLAAVGPHGPEPLLLAAALLKKQRRAGAAIATFRRAAGVRPSALTVRFFLGEAILGRCEWEALVASHLESHGLALASPATTATASVAPARAVRRPLADHPQPAFSLWRRLGLWLVERYHVANGRTQLLLGRLLSSQRRPHEAIRAFQQASLLRQQRLEPSPAWAGRPVDLSSRQGVARASFRRRPVR